MRIGVLGCAGRMGRAVLAEVLAADDLELAGGIEQAGHPAIGQDLGMLAGAEALGSVVEVDGGLLIAASDAVIEFSTPDATLAHAGKAAECATAHVIGTTGLTPAQAETIQAVAARTPVVWAANMSLGVNLLLELVAETARALPPDAFDVEVLEMHHRNKVDAPSGTALALGRAAAAARGVALEQVAERGRDGLTGPREQGRIGFAALRGGDVVGDHMVVFAGSGERIELTHRASDRRIYARGAVQAARWAIGRQPGLYGMADVLGLKRRG